MKFRSYESTPEYLKFIANFGYSEENIHIYSQYENMPFEYFNMLIEEIISYPKIASLKYNSDTKVNQIKDESKNWYSYLIKCYQEKGINCNDFIRFINWSLCHACDAVGLHLPDNIQVGILPLNAICASCWSISQNQSLITIDPCCISILEIFSRQIFSDKEYLKTINELVKCIREYTEDESAPQFQKIVFSYEYIAIEKIKISLFVHSLFFALLHEYAHLCNNHNLKIGKEHFKDANNSQRDFIIYNLTGVNNLSYLYKKVFPEYEADIWAIYFLLKIIRLRDFDRKSLPLRFALASPILFLGVAQAIEDSYIQQQKPHTKEHPPAFDRVVTSDMAFEILGEGWTSEEREFVGKFVISIVNRLSNSLGGAVINDVEIMWRMFDFMLTIDQDITISEFLMENLESWSNPNIQTIEKTITRLREKMD